MKNLLAILIINAFMAFTAMADLPADLNLESYPWYPHKVHITSKLNMDVIFLGGKDIVQTTETYGNAAGETVAKNNNDFIGFTPSDLSSGETGLGWVTINHERMDNGSMSDMLGDGGGMTVFKIDVNNQGKIVVENQTLADGRTGKYFNVDFVNTVGETGMNCGGIVSEVGGRIWTAEEWARKSNSDVKIRDKSDFIVGEGTVDGKTVSHKWSEKANPFDGEEIEAYENFNYMVEIDPREAKAIRKQYNWGRQWYEGGAILSDDQTVILGVDATPGFISMFRAETAGDFTTGDLYVFQQNQNDSKGQWIQVANGSMEDCIDFFDNSLEAGGTMFNRIEWIAYDKYSGKVYLTETGSDNVGDRWDDEIEDAESNGWSAYPAFHHIQRASQQGVAVDANDEDGDIYTDYYGRVLALDVSDVKGANTPEVKVFIEGGPDYPDLGDGWKSDDYVPYPVNHLSSPDGLVTMYIEGKSYLIIQEDLIGTSYGRVHPGLSNKNCEFYIVELDGEESKDVEEDLVRIGVVALGAEATGARPVYDQSGEIVSLLINSQHPANFNEGDFQYAATVSITGWKEAINSIMEDGGLQDPAGSINIYPNPTATEIQFDVEKLGGFQDAALYDMNGKRIRVVRSAKSMYVGDIPDGQYILKFDKEPNIQKVIIQK